MNTLALHRNNHSHVMVSADLLQKVVRFIKKHWRLSSAHHFDHIFFFQAEWRLGCSNRVRTINMDTIQDEKTPLIESADDIDMEDELGYCGSCSPCNPRKSFHRYLILSIMCFLSFGEWFSRIFFIYFQSLIKDKNFY